MEVKTCNHCGKTKDKSFFKERPKPKYRYKDGYDTKCKQCQQETETNRKQENKLKAIAHKGGMCQACGFSNLDYPSVFEFHHLDPKKKDVGIHKLTGGSWAKIELELKKCILLCANCHRIAHEEEQKNGS